MESRPPEAHSREFDCGREIGTQSLLLKGGEVGSSSLKNGGPLATVAFSFAPQPAFFHGWRFIASGSIMLRKGNLMLKEASEAPR